MDSYFDYYDNTKADKPESDKVPDIAEEGLEQLDFKFEVKDARRESQEAWIQHVAFLRQIHV